MPPIASISPIASILKSLETSSSLGMFARDTGGCLISRLGLSRTPGEAREIAFAEISESAIFYFSAPALVKLSSNIFQKKFNLTKEQFQTPYNDLKNFNPEVIKNIKLAKFSQILGVFRNDRIKYNSFELFFKDIFNPSLEKTIIKS